MNCTQLDKDKDGWNIGIRILNIINNIELDQLIFVENQIENLSDAFSRMSDADIPAEISNLRRGQIMQQYQAAALAEANNSQGYLLKLIA